MYCEMRLYQVPILQDMPAHAVAAGAAELHKLVIELNDGNTWTSISAGRLQAALDNAACLS